MRLKRFVQRLLGFVGLLLIVLAGPAPAADYVLGPRDVLKITVYDHPDLASTVRVSEDGKITFPLLGEVRAAGETVQSLERQLTMRLADGYLVQPSVSVFVEQFRSVVYVSGEVAKPGSYPFEDGMTLVHAITLAGGFSEKAKQDNVRVTRKGESGERNEVLALEDALRPNDVVVVPAKRWVYVTGEVNKPGSYLYDEQFTILKAITLAGGLTDKAAPGRTKIIRKRDGKEQTLRGKMEDSVEPEDVIVVPESFF